MPKISILIANYNNGKYFEDTYNSLIEQTEKDWEAIVIDDCSTDDSVKIIEKLIKNDDRFQFYQNDTNIGYQRTLIKAIDISTAEIFGRLDPDDMLTPDAIEESLKAHEEHPDCGLAYSDRWICDENMVKLQVKKLYQFNAPDNNYWNLFDKTKIISHFATFKRCIYNKTEGIDPKNKRAEDADIYMKLVEIAPVKHINKILYLHRFHSNGVSTLQNEEKALFWHWIAIIKAAERRNVNIEEMFTSYYVPRYKVNQRLQNLENTVIYKLISNLKNSKIVKSIKKLLKK